MSTSWNCLNINLNCLTANNDIDLSLGDCVWLSVSEPVGQCISRSVGRSVSRCIDWCVGRSVGSSVGRSVGSSVGQFVGRLFGIIYNSVVLNIEYLYIRVMLVVNYVLPIFSSNNVKLHPIIPFNIQFGPLHYMWSFGDIIRVVYIINAYNITLNKLPFTSINFTYMLNQIHKYFQFYSYVYD